MAAGAGFPLAACADIVLAGQSARFSIAYTKVGLSIDGGSSHLVHSIGLHRTLRLALLHDELTAHDAFEAGLVARVFPDGDLQSQADVIIDQLAAGPSEALGATKRLIRSAPGTSMVASMRNELVSVRSQLAGPDGQEGVAAFLEKRPAGFR
jgi:2-(1,2-epoxy-1,2-dihydrophenyl)acetyl-CoA isomerase